MILSIVHVDTALMETASGGLRLDGTFTGELHIVGDIVCVINTWPTITHSYNTNRS